MTPDQPQQIPFSPSPKQTPYEAIGGAERLRKLVEAFYKRVKADPDLSPIFPEDLTPVMEKQYKFLTQFLGGPSLYTDEYGPPRLRMRHLPFPITPKRAKAWLNCMAQAMDEVGLEGPARDLFFHRLVLTAEHMINAEDDNQPRQ
ncbi:MAG: globin [Bacillus thermozeamaize]|mgnify:FL=1|uniref:Globin n=1 Tax=Bacillus thermozeamaize TaxID=230954 RepID=A0A1Y3PFF1_9BACI|nr:MAG: globin [Bacillus thermozeamaize]